MSQVTLHTVFLNWNRADLLRQTLESYVRTVSVSHNAVVIDNASTDGSGEFIVKFCENRPGFRFLLLTENEGGLAFNRAVESADAEYIHFSENDLEYLPGWDKSLIAKFEAFPRLGQLSLYSPNPKPSEVGPPNVGVPETSGNQTVFWAKGNVSSSSVIRREVWDRGVRWSNYGSDDVKFPDDGKFSADIKALGYGVALNDDHVVINWGHHIEDMISRLPYYLANYEAKNWLGIDGLRKRLEPHGYALVERDGTYELARLSRFSRLTRMLFK